MKPTLLFDLDDTLITNPLESFMSAYLKLLSQALVSYVPPEKMVPQLIKATDMMVANNDPSKTLEEVFDELFYPALGLKKADVNEAITGFYLNQYNELIRVTSPRPEARKIIDNAHSEGYNIVVATNPLFPLIAIHARLNWGGFEDLQNVFSFITSYESMHFAKPNPAYYAEILGLQGWQQTPVCMVGNSLKDDILPSSKIDIPGFWVNADGLILPESVHPGSISGTLHDVSGWISGLDSNAYQATLVDSEAVLAIMRSTIPVIQSLTKTLSEEDWKYTPDQDSLSILELVSHLANVESEINIPRINAVLTSEDPFVAGVDSDEWIKTRDYQRTRTKEVLDELLERRMVSLEVLSDLNSDQWQRKAQHSFFGPTTLLELMRFIALHDIDHIRQIHRLAKNR